QRHGERLAPGTRFPVVLDSPVARIRRDAGPVRVDDLEDVTYARAQTLRANGFRAMAGTPIFVRGRLWGAVVVTALEVAALPPDSEVHLSEFAELVGMAIAN